MEIKLSDVEIVLLNGDLRFIVGEKTLNGESTRTAIPFVCRPSVECSIAQRYAFKVYPTNNLYYIFQNGGKELTASQKAYFSTLRPRFVKRDLVKSESESVMTKEGLIELERRFNFLSDSNQKAEILRRRSDRIINF